MLMAEKKKERVECYDPSICRSTRVSKTNTTTSVQFDNITSVDQTNKCKCVEKK